MSKSFRVPLGIKQGGINSPDFFGCYIDNISILLRDLHIGCHVLGIFLAMILFADDLCLLAPTRNALDRMIKTCAAYCKEFGLSFNASKSKIMVFSKDNIDHDNLSPIYLNGREVEYVDSITYLGATLTSKKGFTFSSSNDLAKYYRASNSLLRATNKPSEEVLLHLLYSCCVPVLTYACAVKEFPAKQMQERVTAMNDSLRFLFGYNRWESVRTLRQSFGYKSLVEIFQRAKNKFHASLPSHGNLTIRHIVRNFPREQE